MLFTLWADKTNICDESVELQQNFLQCCMDKLELCNDLAVINVGKPYGFKLNFFNLKFFQLQVNNTYRIIVAFQIRGANSYTRSSY